MKNINDKEETRERLHRIREFLRKVARCVAACVAACVAIFKGSAEK